MLATPAKRKNRHILETTRLLLKAAHAPQKYWTDAVVASIYLLYRMPSRVLNFETPLQVLSHHVSLPSVLMLPPRIFGCVAFVHINKRHRTKLDPCVARCIFLGYGDHKKGYRCYDPTTENHYATMDVTFIESEMFFSKSDCHSSLRGELLYEQKNKWESWSGFEDVTHLQDDKIIQSGR